MEDTIWIITSDVSEEEQPIGGSKGWGDEIRKKLLPQREVQLSAKELENKMTSFLEIVNNIFISVEKNRLNNNDGVKKNMRLSEIELQVEISAKGEFKLVAGGEVAGRGAITLKFKCSD